MKLFALAYAGLVIAFIFACPRRWVIPALIAGICVIPYAARNEIANVPYFRLFLIVTFLRTVVRGDYRGLVSTRADRYVYWFAVVLMIASFFHEATPSSGPIYIIAPILSMAGVFWITRCTVRSLDDVWLVVRAILISLIPVGIGMLVEKRTTFNFFSALSGLSQSPYYRNGTLRAVGPYGHPILSGAIGGSFFALAALVYWRKEKRYWGAIFCGLVMAFASASSGPILTLMLVMALLGAWRWRHKFSKIPLFLVVMYIVAIPFSTRPPYYIVARIDLAGGSTGFHRAMLIDKTIQHFNEWWLYGTDHTRHWMPMQGAISPNHTDLTNYFIAIGVDGGFFALCVFLLILTNLLRGAYRIYANNDSSSPHAQFAWAFQCVVLGNMLTGLSVSFFGQPVAFYWITLGCLQVVIADYDRRQESAGTQADDVIAETTAPGKPVKQSPDQAHGPTEPASDGLRRVLNGT